MPLRIVRDAIFMVIVFVRSRTSGELGLRLWLLCWTVILVLPACQNRLIESVNVTVTGNEDYNASLDESADVPSAISTDVALTPAPPPSVTAESKRENKMGVHLLLDDGRNRWPAPLWAEHLDYARQAVGEWGYVTELIRLDDLDTERWQQFMDLCAQLELTPVLRLATTFDRTENWWRSPERDSDGTYGSVAARYADFISALAWPADRHYVIVGNEPNHGNEWGGQPDPEAYAQFLIDVADAVHAADPKAVILNAGFDPYTPHTGSQPFSDGMYNMDEESFLDQMRAAHPDVFTHIDVWASHPYPLGPLTDGPWEQAYGVDLLNDAHNPQHVEPPAGINNRGINGYEWELFKLSTYGLPPLPVMITETGWRHAESTDPAAMDNGRPLPDAEMVAQYLDMALYGNDGRYPAFPQAGWTPWLADPRVIAVTPFALNGVPAEWGHTNWLALNSEGDVLGTYAMFDLLATQRTRQ